MSPAGFEPAVSGSERLQTHSLDCAVTGISYLVSIDSSQICNIFFYVTGTQHKAMKIILHSCALR